MCTYGRQLWGTVAISNIAIIQRYQSNNLRMITHCHYSMISIQNSSHDNTSAMVHYKWKNSEGVKSADIRRRCPKYHFNYKTRIFNHSNQTMSGLLRHTFSRLNRRTIHNLNRVYIRIYISNYFIWLFHCKLPSMLYICFKIWFD